MLENNRTLSDSSESRRPSIDGLLICDSKYRLHGEYFAAGSFGKIHFGQHLLTGEIVAAKLVPKDNFRVQLESEYRFYQMLGRFEGIPKIHYFGECDKYNVLVMELLGPSLEKVFGECEHKFSIGTTIRLGIQLIDLMEYIHTQRLIFRNVKPENFCLGRPNTPKANQLYLIGLIHSNVYENDKHEHIPKIKGLPFAGTPRYMSLTAHKGKEQSRRDDLESIGNMLIYFIKGRLPWQGLTASNDADKYEKIYRVKKSIQLEQLCDQLPQELYHYMLYVRTLKFKREPNYQYLRAMFTKLIDKMGLQMSDNYDWDTRRRICITTPTTPTSPTYPPYSSSPITANNYQKIAFKKSVSFDMNYNTVK